MAYRGADGLLDLGETDAISARHVNGHDIPDLVEHFLKRNNTEPEKIEANALKLLMQYNWPGNVRELENIIERLLILAGSDSVTVDMLPPQIRGDFTSDQAVTFDIPDEGLSIEDVEWNLIQNALKKAEGNKSLAAKLLGITRRRLYSMMERLGRE